MRKAALTVGFHSLRMNLIKALTCHRIAFESGCFQNRNFVVGTGQFSV